MENILRLLLAMYLLIVPLFLVLKITNSGMAVIFSFLLGIVGVFILRLPSVKGYFGERIIRKKLEKLASNEYLVINDITLPTKNGSSQIDHIIVSIYGVFVIETKNYSGWIFGDEKSDKWTQVIYKNKEYFHNPIHQNYGHIMSLKNILSDYPNLNYISIVTFTPKCNLKIKVNSTVIYSNKILKEIEKHKDKSNSIEEATNIYNKLLELAITDKKQKKEHVRRIKENLHEKDMKIHNIICPRCGGTLIDRKGRNGKFKGCSNYPKCRFIVNS